MQLLQLKFINKNKSTKIKRSTSMMPQFSQLSVLYFSVFAFFHIFCKGRLDFKYKFSFLSKPITQGETIKVWLKMQTKNLKTQKQPSPKSNQGTNFGVF